MFYQIKLSLTCIKNFCYWLPVIVENWVIWNYKMCINTQCNYTILIKNDRSPIRDWVFLNVKKFLESIVTVIIIAFFILLADKLALNRLVLTLILNIRIMVLILFLDFQRKIFRIFEIFLYQLLYWTSVLNIVLVIKIVIIKLLK